MEVAELLDRCRAGDRLAWEALIRLFQGRVFGLALQYAPDPEEARDLAQEAFVRVWRRLDTFRGHETFASWLLMLTRNLCLDHRRRAASRPPLHDVAVEEARELAGSGDAPDEQLALSRRRRLVRRAIARLTDLNREVLILQEIHGLDVGEIASVLRVPPGTVKSRAFRARLELARTVVALDPSYRA